MCSTKPEFRTSRCGREFLDPPELAERRRLERDDLSSNDHPRSTLLVEHDPRIRGDKPFPKTGIHPRFREGMLFGIML